VSAVAGLSVPFVPRPPAPPVPILREHLGEGFYMVWFQAPGVADAVLGADVRRTLRAREVWNAEWAQREDDLPRAAWLSEADEDVYVEAFTRTGFTGGLNWYRNLDRNWELTAAWRGARVAPPARYLAGEHDLVVGGRSAEQLAAAMAGTVADLRGITLLPGCGHWTQQERPDEVNSALLEFAASLT
jgi:pimeloyl-ACP methyl ester carboxylesterase